jgi:DNA polymerase-3 subunit alpha
LFWRCGSTVGAGRGSACSGLNHYLLGITQLDPIKWNLPFWRYLNPERVELGDIDLDLAPSKLQTIFEEIRKERGELGLVQVCTFGTEGTKSAIQTACRGYRSEDYPNGIDVDEAQYLSSLIPVERGFQWSIHDVVNGDAEKDRMPVTQFINEIAQYPGLLEIIEGIEGLVSRRGSHASGVILFDENIYDSAAIMRTPSGALVTQWDLHMQEAAGSVKYDFLLTSVQDIIIETINLLQKDNKIEKDLSLREIYNKYLHPEVLPQSDKEMWNALAEGKVVNCFQFD